MGRPLLALPMVHLSSQQQRCSEVQYWASTGAPKQESSTPTSKSYTFREGDMVHYVGPAEPSLLSQRYVSVGTNWLNGDFIKVAKVDHCANSRTIEKFQLATSNKKAKAAGCSRTWW